MDRYSNLSLEIDKYLLDKTYLYAIMIDGAWGSGKTFFIKQSTMVINAKKEEN